MTTKRSKSFIKKPDDPFRIGMYYLLITRCHEAVRLKIAHDSDGIVSVFADIPGIGILHRGGFLSLEGALRTIWNEISMALPPEDSDA